MSQFKRKLMDRWKNRRKERQKGGWKVRHTLFHRTLPTEAGGPKTYS